MVREVLRFSSTVAEKMGRAETPSERLVEAFVVEMRECRSNPLVQALKDYDLQSVVEALVNGDNPGRHMVRVAMASLLSDASLPVAAAERVIEFALRVTATLLLSPTALLPTDTDENARTFAAAYLTPAIGAALSTHRGGQP